MNRSAKSYPRSQTFDSTQTLVSHEEQSGIQNKKTDEGIKIMGSPSVASELDLGPQKNNGQSSLRQTLKQRGSTNTQIEPRLLPCPLLKVLSANDQLISRTSCVVYVKKSHLVVRWKMLATVGSSPKHTYYEGLSKWHKPLVYKERGRRGSNPQPPAWQAGALTSWATSPTLFRVVVSISFRSPLEFVSTGI